MQAIKTHCLEGPCLRVHTKDAECGCPADERRIRQEIEGVQEPVAKGPSYAALDRRIADMRLKLYVDAYLDCVEQGMNMDCRFKNEQRRAQGRALRQSAAKLIASNPDPALLFTKLEELVRTATADHRATASATVSATARYWQAKCGSA